MRKNTYKVVDLFGNEELRVIEKNKTKANLFGDYDEFLNKFEAKKTTDDCHTPDEVYEIVLNYVRKNCDIEGKCIVRPFWPGGDYRSIEYKPDDVVIDNPPFSLLAQIMRFYLSRDIPFFLFAPHLTLFSSDQDYTAIVVGVGVKYENDALVKTSFVSSLFGDAKVIGEPDLYRELNAINERKKENLPTYVYPSRVLTVSMVAKMVLHGVRLYLRRDQVQHIRALASQRTHKKAIFGSGYLLSDLALIERTRADAKTTAAQQQITQNDEVEAIEWELSDAEFEVINRLSKNEKNNNHENKS